MKAKRAGKSKPVSDRCGVSVSAFLKRVKDTVKQHDMLHRGDRVLAAVSGGPDSVCLLEALLRLRRELDLEVIVGNMDHGLRGAVSRRDSEFVKELSKKSGLKCVHGKVDLRSVRKRDISVEEWAREKRYAFLAKAAESNNCNVIATGHTMDDQAETVLMRIICGASFAGITGIPPVRDEDKRRIIRPLIRTERRDVLSFLKTIGSKYVEDSTNLDMKFLRNSVRHEILPLLEKYNPGLKRSLVNLSDTLREDFVFLDAEKKRIIKEHAGERASTGRIKVKDIMLQPKALRKELFKELFKRAGGNVKKLTYRHWIDMDYFLRAAERNKSLDFPGNVRVTKCNDEIVFRKRRG
jgi:tRNA(Ile)-lysidine synthase